MNPARLSTIGAVVPTVKRALNWLTSTLDGRGSSDKLGAPQDDAQALKSGAASDRAPDRMPALLKGQQHMGAANHPALLTAEQTYRRASLMLAQVKVAQFAAAAARLRPWAVGGGTHHKFRVAKMRLRTAGQ
jgi:hypothetical protein